MDRFLVILLVTFVLFCLIEKATTQSNSTNSRKSNRTSGSVRGAYDEARMREHLRRADLGDPKDPESDDDDDAGRWRRLIESQRDRQFAPSGGATYIRWGRNVCPEEFDTELVYSGVAGGGYYDNIGSGSNLICLTRQPEFDNYTAALEGHATIYGAEYEAPGNFFSNRNSPTNIVNSLQDQDIPCAVCRAETRTSMIMIPGRKSCQGEGWTREYWGYLATGHYSHKNQLQYICVDEAPEGDPKGSGNANGALLYVVQGVCGSLPCPPYVNGYELTCTVCTK